MSKMMFCVLDADRSLCAPCPAQFTDQFIPALCDDPETIEELQHAMRRFQPPDDPSTPLRGWSPGESERSLDGGICIVDLAARLIVYQSTFCPFLRHGQVTWDDYPPDEPSAARWIPYRIADDWKVTEQLKGWRADAQQRRRRRQADPPFDSREVLYNQVIPFIVEQCFAARGGLEDGHGVWTPPGSWQWRELPRRTADGKTISTDDAVAEIHARWLMTPRSELRGQSPRDVLHAQRSRIAMQIEDREFQWSSFGQCPSPLWRESIAYCFGGYGIHENVIYYELLRGLISRCWTMVVDCPAGQGPPAPEVVADRLGAAKQEWLHTPGEDYGGKTPARVIQSERLRLPEGGSGEEAVIDCDCPLCLMMAESGPMFWHLDGCNMDADFPFSLYHTTREEWEREQCEWAQLDSRHSEQDVNEGDVRDKPLPWDDDEPAQSQSSVWNRSFSYQRSGDSGDLTLFGLGGHLAELIVDSKELGEASERIYGLNRDFGNLREAVANPSGSLVDPVVSSLCDKLALLSDTQPKLAEKCEDLQRQLREFARQISGEMNSDHDVPF